MVIDICDGITMLYSYCIYVFFFKQKTAYELRISDWSSDVCSSDLGVGETGIGAQAFQARVQRGHVVMHRSFQALVFGGAHVGPAHIVADEIGSASCRERVCPYV